MSHSGIVAVYDLGSDHGVEFMALEWLIGDNLATILSGLESKRIALNKALEIVQKVGEALAWSHAAGVVHGDVKPSNIFIGDNRATKVLDFGAPGPSPSATAVRDQASWATPVYASCAVLEGEPPRADFQRAISSRVPTFAYGALALLIVVAIVLWAIPDGGSRSDIGSLFDNATAALSAGRLVGRHRRELLVSAQRVSTTDLPQAKRYLAQAAAMSR